VNRRRLIIGASVLSLLTIAGAATTIATQTSFAQSPTPTPSSGTTKHASNEDPAHEAKESAEQEAAEDSGTFAGHSGFYGSNEDPAHEAKESKEQEAQEDAHQNAGIQNQGTSTTKTRTHMTRVN
jgi:cytoskeletal protein RodZ